MKSCALALALSLTAFVRADDPAGTFSSRSDIQVYREATEVWARSPFNRIASLPDNAWIAEWRPDVDGSISKFDATLRPRALAEIAGNKESSDLWLNEGWLRLRPIDGVSLLAGRETLLWGPATFWNPSNPFYIENNKANPNLELGGRDFVQARWQWNRAWTLSAISEVGRGHNSGGAARCDAIKLDWVGDNASAALLAAADLGRPVGWYGWTQWTASDALLLYGEAGWSSRIVVTAPESAAGPTGWQLDQRTGGRRLKLLVGGAYTFINGWALNAEIWRNGNGLTNDEARQAGQAVDSLGRQPTGPADAQLGALLGTTPVPYRRDYAGLQLMNSGDAKTGWMARYTFNLDDGSGGAVALLRQDLGDRVQAWASLAENFGGHASEYGRWVRNSITLGVTWFMW